MKAILISPYPYYAKGVEGIVYPPLGLLYMSAAAKKDGLAQVRVLDANILRMQNETILSEIRDYRPDIIGISSNIVTHRAAIELMRMIREDNAKGLLVAGGPYPAIFPEKYLSSCDIVVDGEGERTFREIITAHENGKDFSSIKGIIYKNEGSFIKNERRELIEDLDTLPLPDYQALTPPLEYYSRHSRVIRNIMAPLLTSRGCPYQCTYCNKSVFGVKFRCRSPQNILYEMAFLHRQLKVDQFDIMDDNFNLIPERAEEVLDGVIQMSLPIAISCHNGLRADKISEALAKKLKKSGVFKVGLGIETADEELMGRIKKNLDLDKVKEAITLLRRERITTHGYFIFGLPGDTPASMGRTIAFAKEANPHFCNFTICIPFPGTETYETVKKEGRFLEDVDDGVASGFFKGKAFFEINGTKASDVEFYYKKAYKDFYGNIKKIVDIIFSINNVKEAIWLLGTFLSLAANMAIKPSKKNEN